MHSGEQYCIFSGGTSNTETEKPIFQTLNNIKSLSRKRYIYNALIRTQAEFLQKQNPNEVTLDETVSANLNQPIEKKCKDSWFHLNG